MGGEGLVWKKSAAGQGPFLWGDLGLEKRPGGEESVISCFRRAYVARFWLRTCGTHEETFGGVGWRIRTGVENVVGGLVGKVEGP